MPPGRDEEHGRGGSGTAHHIGAPADQLAEDPEEVDDAEDPEPEELEEPEVLEVLLDESLEELEVLLDESPDDEALELLEEPAEVLELEPRLSVL